MKHCLRGFILGCILSTAGCLFVSIDTTAEANPVLYFPEPAYTFPITIEGVEINHDFVIKNTGDKELKILKVRTG